MNKKKLLVALTIGIFLSGCSPHPTKQNPFPKNAGSEYQYDEPPKICFFPIDKSKWDGSKVTIKNWEQLTDYQKARFISEGVTEIENNSNVTIKVEDYRFLLSVIDTRVKMFNKELSDADILMIKFLKWYLLTKGESQT